MTTLSMAAGIISRDNLDAVLSAVRGRSRREVEEYLADLKPRTALPREEIRPLCVTASPDAAQRGIFAVLEQKLSMNPAAAGEGKIEDASRRTALPAAESAPRGERRYALKFTINAGTQAKLEEARVLLSSKYPWGVKLEDIFEEALEQFLERRSPKRRMARRAARGSHAQRGAKPESARDEAPCGGGRHIPAAVRDAVFVREGGRCGYVSRDGVRCGARHDLEFHHIEPYARGGESRVENIMLACRQHNGLEAIRVYGASFMADKAAPKGETDGRLSRVGDLQSPG